MEKQYNAIPISIPIPHHYEMRVSVRLEFGLCGLVSTAVKRPRRFSFYLVGFYLILSGNMGKDV